MGESTVKSCTYPSHGLVPHTGIRGETRSLSANQPAAYLGQPLVPGGDSQADLHEDLPGCPARKSGEEWQPIAKRRQIPSWLTKAPPGRAGFFTTRIEGASDIWLIPPGSLAFLSWKGTHVGLGAAVERAHSYRARSGSKGSVRVSFHSFLSWGLCEQKERSACSFPILLRPRLREYEACPLYLHTPSPSAIGVPIIVGRLGLLLS